MVFGFISGLEEQQTLDASVKSVLQAHEARTGKGFKDNTRKAEAKLKGGFVVGSKTRVTKNY